MQEAHLPQLAVPDEKLARVGVGQPDMGDAEGAEFPQLFTDVDHAVVERQDLDGDQGRCGREALAGFFWERHADAGNSEEFRADLQAKPGIAEDRKGFARRDEYTHQQRLGLGMQPVRQASLHEAAIPVLLIKVGKRGFYVFFDGQHRWDHDCISKPWAAAFVSRAMTGAAGSGQSGRQWHDSDC
jgi:hypothetical protein